MDPRLMMGDTLEFLMRAVLMGAGATLLMDGWALLLRQLGVRSLDFALLGRWIGNLPRGPWIHENIAKAPPVRGERVIGWAAHYGIGVAFASLLLALFGLDWARSPSFLPALGVGVVTVVAPLFVMQPALGAGVASSRTPRPLFNSAKSLATHTVFGTGLYLAALLLTLVLPTSR
jgi:hypothetical protein